MKDITLYLVPVLGILTNIMITGSVLFYTRRGAIFNRGLGAVAFIILCLSSSRAIWIASDLAIGKVDYGLYELAWQVIFCFLIITNRGNVSFIAHGDHPAMRYFKKKKEVQNG